MTTPYQWKDTHIFLGNLKYIKGLFINCIYGMLEEKVQSSHKKADNRDNTWIYHMLWAVKQQHCWWDDSDKKFTCTLITNTSLYTFTQELGLGSISSLYDISIKFFIRDTVWSNTVNMDIQLDTSASEKKYLWRTDWTAVVKVHNGISSKHLTSFIWRALKTKD